MINSPVMPVSGFLRAYRVRFIAAPAGLHVQLLLVAVAAAWIAAPSAARAEPVQPVAPESGQQAQAEPVQPVGPESEQQAEAPPSDPFRQALTAGVGLGLSAFAALALYSWLAPRLRSYAAHLKARRLHRRAERQRRRGRRR